MRREQGNVTGIVALTVCITAAVLIGGWFVASRYLGQQTVSDTHEDKPAAEAPVARRKTPKAPKQEDARGGSNDREAQPAATPAAPPGKAKADAPSANEDNEPAKPAAGSAAAEPPPLVATELPTATVDAATPPAAANSQSDARAIMEDVQRRSEVKSYRYDGLLQAFDANEHNTEKRWTFERLGSHGQSKGVVRFTAPPEVKGVALLIHNHPDRASDQWMWTPALERDRRIAMQDRSTRFFGTDFSFEDLEERDVEQFDYTMLGSETLDGAECWKIQSSPKRSKSSQYTQSISWIRKDHYLPVRIDSFIKNEAVRRLTYSTIENIQGIWTARVLDMKDLRHATHTRLTLQQVKYGPAMKDDDFTLQALRR